MSCIVLLYCCFYKGFLLIWDIHLHISWYIWVKYLIGSLISAQLPGGTGVSAHQLQHFSYIGDRSICDDEDLPRI